MQAAPLETAANSPLQLEAGDLCTQPRPRRRLHAARRGALIKLETYGKRR